jgi:two-component system, sensor histidine kinase and response regulator
VARVLVIDDEAGIRNVLRSTLEASGFEVVLADDGLRGIGVARRQRPDAIVLDLMMPVMDGHTVLDILRADEKTRYVPVVVLSALTQPAVKERCLAQGVASFIAKPFDPSDVTAALRDALP